MHIGQKIQFVTGEHTLLDYTTGDDGRMLGLFLRPVGRVSPYVVTYFTEGVNEWLSGHYATHLQEAVRRYRHYQREMGLLTVDLD